MPSPPPPIGSGDSGAAWADLLKPVYVGAALALLAIAIAFGAHAGWEGRWLYATRWTARVSLLLFAAAYLIRTIPARRASGLSFAGAHFVHAGTFITYLATYDVQRSLLSTVGGAVGYVVLTAMVVVTFVPVPASAGLRRWGMAYLWTVFMFSYLGRLVENGDRRGEGAFGVLILLAIPVVRLLGRRRSASAHPVHVTSTTGSRR